MMTALTHFPRGAGDLRLSRVAAVAVTTYEEMYAEAAARLEVDDREALAPLLGARAASGHRRSDGDGAAVALRHCRAAKNVSIACTQSGFIRLPVAATPL